MVDTGAWVGVWGFGGISDKLELMGRWNRRSLYTFARQTGIVLWVTSGKDRPSECGTWLFLGIGDCDYDGVQSQHKILSVSKT